MGLVWGCPADPTTAAPPHALLLTILEPRAEVGAFPARYIWADLGCRGVGAGKAALGKLDGGEEVEGQAHPSVLLEGSSVPSGNLSLLVFPEAQ